MSYYRRMLVVALLVPVTALGAQGKKKSEDGIPADKKEIVDRFLAGTLDASYTPALSSAISAMVRSWARGR